MASVFLIPSSARDLLGAREAPPPFPFGRRVSLCSWIDVGVHASTLFGAVALSLTLHWVVITSPPSLILEAGESLKFHVILKKSGVVCALFVTLLAFLGVTRTSSTIPVGIFLARISAGVTLSTGIAAFAGVPALSRVVAPAGVSPVSGVVTVSGVVSVPAVGSTSVPGAFAGVASFPGMSAPGVAGAAVVTLLVPVIEGAVVHAFSLGSPFLPPTSADVAPSSTTPPASVVWRASPSSPADSLSLEF